MSLLWLCLIERNVCYRNDNMYSFYPSVGECLLFFVLYGIPSLDKGITTSDKYMSLSSLWSIAVKLLSNNIWFKITSCTDVTANWHTNYDWWLLLTIVASYPSHSSIVTLLLSVIHIIIYHHITWPLRLQQLLYFMLSMHIKGQLPQKTKF